MERFSDTRKLPKNDLTDTDKNAIEYFSKRNDLVITKADKGGPTVILDVKGYMAKANEQLQGNSFYQKLNVDPTARHSDIVNSAIESFRKQELLSNSTAIFTSKVLFKPVAFLPFNFNCLMCLVASKVRKRR